MTQKRKMRGWIWMLLILFVIAAVVLWFIFGGNAAPGKNAKGNGKHGEPTDAFLASREGRVLLYSAEETVEKGFLGRVKSRSYSVIAESYVPRGAEVKVTGKTVTPESDTAEGKTADLYREILLDENTYYVRETNLATDWNDVVQETERFVRTPATLYETPGDYFINGYLPKGTALEIIGYDNLDAEGNVHMYHVKATPVYYEYTGGTAKTGNGKEGNENGSEKKLLPASGETVTGWVYAKYLEVTQEKADAPAPMASFHKSAVYSHDLYGGDPLLLDYYPVEKPVFPENPMPEDVRAMYLNINCGSRIGEYLKIAEEKGVNAMCVDYDIWAPNDYGDMVKAIKEAGLYLIARIVCFKDPTYASAHPEECIQYYASKSWPSAYSRNLWEYKVSVALDAVLKYGFNEIQFDYVRFPESSYDMSDSGNCDFRNTYGESKSQAVQNFLLYACDVLHQKHVYVSADVFGECSNGYVTAYGQYWPALSNVVDVISSMPYLDHFSRTEKYWTDPYWTVSTWAEGARSGQTMIPTPAIPRTWLTGYDVPYWESAAKKIRLDAGMLSKQAQALWDKGLTGGFLVWHSGSNLSNYAGYDWAWSKDYRNGQT